MAKIDDFFRLMAEHGASDLHLIAGQPPTMRIDGELGRVAGHSVLVHAELKEVLNEIAPNSKKEHF